jgi:hypothetical protein
MRMAGCGSSPARPGALALALAVALAAPWGTPQAPAQQAGGTQPAPASDPEPGGEVEVVLTDGRRLAGVLVERSPDRLVLRVGGVDITLPGEGVAQVARVPGVEERYEALRAAIDPKDADELVRLAEWLRSKGRLDLALWEVDRALEAEPLHARARELRREILAQQELRESAGRPAGPRPSPPPRQSAPPFPLLTPEQINIIRVYEVDLRNPPRMVIPRDVVRRFLTDYAGRQVEGLGTVPATPEGHDLFVRQAPADILAWFFAARARELYPLVQVKENPASMRMFIRDVNATWLTNTCATTRCHGGEEAGRLWLYPLKPSSDGAAYTNFLILDRFRTGDGAALIDYDQPERSVLLQYALPRDQVARAHPDADAPGRKWRPAFRGRDDDRYEKALAWIRAMYKPRPAYPVDYEPPVPGAARSREPGAR